MTKHSIEELKRWDSEHVWHPFTPHSVYGDESPLMIAGGEGNYLIDIEGRRYLDGVSSLWCNVFGHRKKEIDEAVAEQLGRLAHSTFLGNASWPAVALAKRLVDITPAPLTRVFFSDNGSTSVEVALKIAFQYWQQQEDEAGSKRTRFLSLDNAYHGDTIGAVSVGGMDLFHERYGALLFDVLRAPSPYCYRCPLNLEREHCEMACAARAEKLIEDHSDDLAAVILEPAVQGAAGMIVQPEGYLKRVAAATKRAGALLILDEVAVGFGRSAKTMFACQEAGVDPDLMCLAKGLTGGYLPVAATLATEQIFSAFLGPPEEGKTFFHGHTYTGNALGSAAALATLDIFESEEVLEALPAKAAHLEAELAQKIKALPGVGDVRQYGLMVGIELVSDRARRKSFPPNERRGMRVCQVAARHGVFLRPLGDTVVLMPPLSITHEELCVLVDAVRAGITEVLGDAQ